VTYASAAAIAAPMSWGDRNWQRILSSRRVQAGIALTVPVMLIALVGPLATPHSPTAFVEPAFSGSSKAAPFGTDVLGRDVLSRFLAGGRDLLALSAAATIWGVGLGALLGCWLAYVRGWLDAIVMRFADVLLAFPAIVLSLMFVSILGPQQWLIIVAVGVSHLPRTLRVIRGAAMSVVERDFIRYGEAIGLRRVKMVILEILPNVTGALMVEVGIRFTFSIGLVASLDFLGVGVQPPAPDWGLMINENRIGLGIQPWGVVLPLIAIATICIGSNLIADGIARVVGGIEDTRS